MKHLVQRIVFIGALLLVLLGLSVAYAGAYDAGEVAGSDGITAAAVASGGDAEIFPVSGTPELKEEYLTFIREHNLNATETRLQAAASDRVVREYHPGDQEKFWCRDFYLGQYYKITATCQYAGSHGYIFVENGNPVPASAVADLGGAFDSVIYPTNVDTFGQDVDTDGDSKIFLLLLDIRDEWYYSGASKTYICGYFSVINTWPSTYFPCSNEKDMIYLDTRPATHNHRLQVTAHEFQHLIHHGYDEDEYLWIDEGCADYAEYACFGVLEDSHVRRFLERPYVPLCDPDWNSYDGYDCLARYGASLLWTVYLSEQQGDLSGDPGRQHFIRDLVAEKKNGIAGIDAVLERYGEADRFESIFKRWVIANYLDDASRDPAYGYLQIDLPAKPAVQAEAALGTEPVSFPQNSLKSYAAAYYAVELPQSGSVICSCDRDFYTRMSNDGTSAMVLVSPLSDSGTYTLTVKPADDGTSLLPIPGHILAADYDAGGEGVAYHDTTPGNIDSNPSSYRGDDVDIGIRDWDSDPLITNTVAGEWLRYTVDVAEAGTYEVEYLLYTTRDGCTLALDVDGVSAHLIAVPEAASWRTPIRVKGQVTFPTGGEYALVLRVSGDMNLNGMTFSKKPSVQPTLAIPGRILAADYDAGGEGVAYHDTTPGNIDSNPSSYRNDDVDIGIRDWDTDPLITNTAAGEWLRYTVDVAEAGIYDVEYLLYTTQGGCTLALDVDGASAHLIPVQEASSWRTPIRVKGAVTFPTAGEHELILRVSGDMNLNGITFTGEGSASLDIPGRILAADYDAGGEGIAYHDTTPGNIDSNPSSYRNDDVDIGIRDWDAVPLITNTAEGEWLCYTVDVQEADAYEVEYLVYTTQGGCTLALDVDGVSAHLIPVQEASSWRTPIRVKGAVTFPTAGEHELILRVSGDMNLNGMTFSGGGSASLDADFTASPTSGPAPLTVQFTDTSAGTPTAWFWTFGDGATSTEQHPVHTYTDPGTYTVSLTVDDAAGSDTETKADCIAVASPLVSIAWQRCLGGSGSDVASIIQQTSDGGYIVAGSTESTDGDVGGNHGGYDIWVVKLDADGGIEWQRCLGGSGNDVAWSIHQISDGGYIIGGQTESTDGDVSGNHGVADIWLVKLDSGGTISWQRCIGGSNYDGISNICQTSDGGYILAGETESNDGDLSGYHDRNDTWLVKIDPDGLIEWEKSFGPIMINTCAQQTDDGGYVLCGWCWAGHGMFDGYVLKVDATGALEWQSYLGGSRRDFVYSILQTGDGGYIVAGSTQSDDLAGYHWDPDAADFCPDGMAVKLDVSGAIEWQRCLGGYDSDGFSSVDLTSDGGYVLAGYAASNDGDVSGNHGNTDVWMGKLDAGGSIEGQQCIGGSGSDRASSIRQTADGGYIVAGFTDSNDGDVSGNHGASDLWVAKLESA